MSVFYHLRLNKLKFKFMQTNRFFLIAILSIVSSIAFGQLKVSTNGSFGTTTNVPLNFNVNSVKSGTTGSQTSLNVSFGYQTLNSISSGGNNTAMGYNALRANQTGSYNTAYGCSALDNTLGSYNTATGADALSRNVSGNQNSAFGQGALYNNTSGHYNTSIGYMALTNNATGNYNTAVGFMAGVSSGNLSNTIAIGYNAIVTSNDQIRLGNYTVTSVGSVVSWSIYSDGRIKRNIRADVPGLSFIKKLHPVTYNLNFDSMDELFNTGKTNVSGIDVPIELDEREKTVRAAREKEVHTGFIAQEVEKTAKSIGYEFSGVEVDEVGIYSLRYAEFVVPLVKAVQELSEQNERMQEQINELKKENDLLKISPRSVTSSEQVADMPRAVLYQNAPNPFSERTVIKFELHDNTANASIMVFNMQGALVKQFPIQRQQQSITINGSELASGMYFYSLIVNGQEIDTKRMILTK